MLFNYVRSSFYDNAPYKAPSDISKILTEKFRIPTIPNAVGMALMKTGSYTDRTPIDTLGGRAYRYRIMLNGEAYIKNKLKHPSSDIKAVKNTRKKPRGKNVFRKEGLKARIITLVNEDFFSEPKKANEVQIILRDRGYFYMLDAIRVTLFRLVKRNELRRIREYKGKQVAYKYVNS